MLASAGRPQLRTWRIEHGRIGISDGMRGEAGRKRSTQTATARRSAPTDRRGATRVRERNCSVARTLGILSDAWTFLVIREAFFGAKRF